MCISCLSHALSLRSNAQHSAFPCFYHCTIKGLAFQQLCFPWTYMTTSKPFESQTPQWIDLIFGVQHPHTLVHTCVKFHLSACTRLEVILARSSDLPFWPSAQKRQFCDHCVQTTISRLLVGAQRPAFARISPQSSSVPPVNFVSLVPRVRHS